MSRRLAILVALTASSLVACGSVQPPSASVSPAGSATSVASPSPASVEWLALPATNQFIAPSPAAPAPPIAIPPGTPACSAGELEVARGAGSGATGHTNEPIVFRDRAGTACVLQGFPDLAIIGTDGQTLAQGVGSAGRGTFFLDGPSVPVLMEPDTWPLQTTYDPAAPVGVRGQAYVNIEWWDCRARTAAQLLITLSDGGGHLSLPFAGITPVSPACGAPNTVTSYLARGSFDPSGFLWPPAPESISVSIAILPPPAVRRGSTLFYTVTLTNLGDQPYQLNPCPDYFEFIGGKRVRSTYALNCGPVGAVPAGGHATFAMQMEVPATMPTGPSDLMWGLLDGRITPSNAAASINIVE